MKRFMEWFVAWLSKDMPPSIYRKVVKTEGEIIELECGHAFRIIRHERESFPCAACLADAQSPAASLSEESK